MSNIVEVERVAKGLTAGERATCCRSVRLYEYGEIHGRVRLNLFRKRLMALVGWAGPSGKQFPLAGFTPLGVAVRAHILALSDGEARG